MERLRSPQEFKLVYRQGRPYFGRFIVISALPTGRAASRVGFAVSKKVGNAVVRNKVKRRLRAIVHDLYPQMEAGYDIVVGAKRSIVQASFFELERDLSRVMQGSGFLARSTGGEDYA